MVASRAPRPAVSSPRCLNQAHASWLLSAVSARVCGVGACVSVGTCIHTVSTHRARACPSARPSPQPRKLSRRRADPHQGAWLTACVAPAASPSAAGRQTLPGWGRGCTLPAEPGSQRALPGEHKGRSFQSLLSCDPPLTLSPLFCFLLFREGGGRRGGREERRAGGGWRLGPSSWQHPPPTSRTRSCRGHLLAQTVAQRRRGEGILMSL